MRTTNRSIRGHSGARRVQALALLLGIALSAGLLAPTSASAATQVTATENVNIRAKPSTTAKMVGALYRGQTVTAISKSAHWTKISFEGGKAYVASRYLSGGSRSADREQGGCRHRQDHHGRAQPAQGPGAARTR